MAASGRIERALREKDEAAAHAKNELRDKNETSCPNCGNAVPMLRPATNHAGGCVLGSLLGVIEDRGDLAFEAVDIETIETNYLWDRLGSLVSDLEAELLERAAPSGRIAPEPATTEADLWRIVAGYVDDYSNDELLRLGIGRGISGPLSDAQVRREALELLGER